jgi:prephenate dehydratase
MRISYLGPIGTFSHQAVTNYISDNNSVSYELLPCKTITEAILMLISSDADISIVPIENSIQGSVFETIDTLFENENLTILKDFILDVNQNLLSNFKKNEIQKIYSHPQGIAQCTERGKGGQATGK